MPAPGHGFPTVKYDITDNLCQALQIALCPILFTPLIPGMMGTKTLTLEPEEAVYSVDCAFCTKNQRKPYGELGSVDVVVCFGCLHTVGTNFDFPICPRSGCDKDMSDEITAELKKRMKERGDTGQVRRSEQAVEAINHAHVKLDLILQHLNIPVPPPQQTLDTTETDHN